MANINDIKLYAQMTAQEQSAYREQMETFVAEKLSDIEHLQMFNPQQRTAAEEGMVLIASWQFARQFAADGLQYGDLEARVYRLRYYFDEISAEIERLTPAPAPAKRGRPASPATIAKREAEEKQPKLFDSSNSSNSSNSSISSPPSAESAEKLVLSQLKWLMSAELAADVDNIRTLRATASAAAERAKAMSDMHAKPEAIAPIAQQAAQATDAYQAIYERVDRELATVWYRLKNDGEYLQRFRERWKKNDVKDVLKLLHPYWQKLQDDKAFEASVKLLIQQESPEFVAKQKADAEKKKEVQDILRYLKRKDKQHSPDTAREKFKRLEQLLGKKDAADYKPLLDKIIEDKKKDGKKKEKNA